MMSRCIPAAIAAVALAACSPTEQERAPEAVQQPSATADPMPEPSPTTANSGEISESATTGGDGSPIRLSPLGSGEVEAADLGGELGCSFANAERETLLLAMGNVASQEPAFGIVKVGDYVESVSTPGGFDAMIRGATFVGKGKTLVVDRTSSQPVGGGESPPYPATLTYQRADGASRTFEGLWTCGP